MKKNLSFEKDLEFDNRLGEIVSICLEDDLKFTDENTVNGNFYVSGEYKMYDASTIVENFSYNIPVEISTTENFNLEDSKTIIDNFTYEIIDNSILRCNIAVILDGSLLDDDRDCDDDIIPDDLKELPTKERNENMEVEETKETDEDNKTIEIEDEEEIKEESKEEKKENKIKVNSLFANLGEESDTFTTYSVYIMREEDSIEKVMEKYKVSKEELQNYNDLSKVELNSKIIIPTNKDE